jgi:hypothetical protein
MTKERSIEEMRHDIIEYAINLDYWLDQEITSHFGLDNERKTFIECFLERTDFSVKLDYVIKIIKSIGEAPYKGFKKDGYRFAEIRNKFAHHSYPNIMEDTMPKMQIDFIKTEQKEWVEMYEEAKALFKKIMNELDNKFYTKEPRRRRYRSWALLEKLDIIKGYEEMLKDERE